MPRATSKGAPAKENPKSEARNTKQTKRLKPQSRNPKRLVWNFLIFAYLKLFRISDFEFRTSYVLGVVCAFAGVTLFRLRLDQPFVTGIQTEREPATEL